MHETFQTTFDSRYEKIANLRISSAQKHNQTAVKETYETYFGTNESLENSMAHKIPSSPRMSKKFDNSASKIVPRNLFRNQMDMYKTQMVSRNADSSCKCVTTNLT